ncbi:RsiV family protein [Vallitalea guaymasensis]|uniref:RsiV family protein n=1 Tax=Vallitalea guaymasensis TaxID=1185412 RepID=UPI002354BF13|nr:RsiV family protein [Vallitalea guaymasensis]
MSDKKLEKLKNEYMNIPVSDKLDFIVKDSIKKGVKKNMRKNNIIRWVGAVAASLAIFVTVINCSETSAKALADVPIISNLVKVFTFREYKVSEDNHEANIKVPSIDGLENEELELSLNEKYVQEGKELYNKFMDEIKDEEEYKGPSAVNSGYNVITDTDKIFAIERYIVEIRGSSREKIKYDTIDKEKEILITLPSLFKDDSYIEIISNNIREQMEQQMKTDENVNYFFADKETGETGYDKIASDQNFYIDDKNQLVISFDEYEVAPGCMGVVKFVVPTEIISDILVGDEYIK